MIVCCVVWLLGIYESSWLDLSENSKILYTCTICRLHWIQSAYWLPFCGHTYYATRSADYAKSQISRNIYIIFHWSFFLTCIMNSAHLTFQKNYTITLKSNYLHTSICCCCFSSISCSLSTSSKSSSGSESADEAGCEPGGVTCIYRT